LVLLTYQNVIICALYIDLVLEEQLLSNEFTCMLGVRQTECLSPLLCSLYLNDLEEMLLLNGHM